MKKLILLIAVCIGMYACGNKNVKENKAVVEQPQQDCVEVLYFHGKQRCVTCTAIEQNAKEALEAQFADELKAGTVVFKSIDISKPENRGIAEKYEVAWSSLFVCKWKGGRETFENLTMYAFANARVAPDAFKEGVVEKVNALLE